MWYKTNESKDFVSVLINLDKVETITKNNDGVGECNLKYRIVFALPEPYESTNTIFEAFETEEERDKQFKWISDNLIEIS
jgi:hypothetical protein